MMDPEKIENEVCRRNDILREAVQAADKIITDAFDNGVENIDLLTAHLALAMLNISIGQIAGDKPIVRLTKTTLLVVESAVRAAERIIKIKCANDLQVVREALIARVASEFCNKARMIFDRKLLRYDVEKT